MLALIRRLLPVTDPQFFAGFTGLCHALPGLGVFWLLHSGFGLRRPLGVAVAATVALAFSFNGLALAIARYPHFEILIVGTFILFSVALIRRQLVVAGVCFGICLATREDAGFHVFALLFLLLLLNRRQGVPWQEQRPEIAFAVIALLYSITVLALQLTLLTGQSSLARIYLGDPPFSTLTLATVIERFLGWLAISDVYRPAGDHRGALGIARAQPVHRHRLYRLPAVGSSAPVRAKRHRRHAVGLLCIPFYGRELLAARRGCS